MILAPENCPSCGSRLERAESSDLFCRNSECLAQGQKKLEHFCKVLKIKGLGPKTIEKLNIQQITDLYDFSEQDLIMLLGCSEGVAKKLKAEIEHSKSASLNSCLAAFSIPLIGPTASNKICSVVEHISDIDEDALIRAGIGPAARSSLLSWLATDFLDSGFVNLPVSFTSKTQLEETTNSEVVCITGKLVSFKTKAEAAKLLEAKGYKVKSSVTKDVTILVNESGIESEKTKKARASGITIFNSIKDLLGED